MDMSQHPAADTSAATPSRSTTKGEIGALVLALVLVAALGGGFALAGIGGLTMVMLAAVPVIYITIVLLAWGK